MLRVKRFRQILQFVLHFHRGGGHSLVQRFASPNIGLGIGLGLGLAFGLGLGLGLGLG